MSHDLTGVAAGAAIFSPWWLPALQSVSTVFAAVLPIIGVAWLVLQITFKVIDWRARRKGRSGLNIPE